MGDWTALPSQQSMAHDDDDAKNDVCGFQCQLRKTRQAMMLSSRGPGRRGAPRSRTATAPSKMMTIAPSERVPAVCTGRRRPSLRSDQESRASRGARVSQAPALLEE